MKLTRYILIFLFVASCSNQNESNSITPLDKLELNSDLITVATFNIAWLGDSKNDRIARSESDYKKIASVIHDLEADLIGLQEIENQNAIEKILKYLPGYYAMIGSSGGDQNTGIIYHSGLKILSFSEYKPLAIEEGRHRPGFIVSARKGNFDFILMDVHFKSTSRYDDTPEKKDSSYLIRSMQAKLTSNWADSILQYSTEKDIIILGDFNDNPNDIKNSTLDALMDNLNLNFLTGSLKSCKSEFWSSIDHIVISKSIESRLILNSTGIYNIYSAYTEPEAEMISDHCPVFTKFDVLVKDND